MIRQLTILTLLGFGALSGSAFGEPPSTRYTLEGGLLVLPSPITFKTGTDTLEPASDPALAYIQGFLTARQDVTLVRIESHTDPTGSESANQALTEKRAMAVARWLVAKGIACKRVIPTGFGSTKPLAPNATPEERAKNRRIAVAVAMLRGKAIGGLPVDGGGRVSGDPCP